MVTKYFFSVALFIVFIELQFLHFLSHFVSVYENAMLQFQILITITKPVPNQPECFCRGNQSAASLGGSGTMRAAWWGSIGGLSSPCPVWQRRPLSKEKRFESQPQRRRQRQGHRTASRLRVCSTSSVCVSSMVPEPSSLPSSSTLVTCHQKAKM